MAVKTFNVSFPKELAEQIDEAAKAEFGSRSDFLRAAAIEKLKAKRSSDIRELKELMAYGKAIGNKIGHFSEAEVAAEITADRRKKRRWKPEDHKSNY